MPGSFSEKRRFAFIDVLGPGGTVSIWKEGMHVSKDQHRRGILQDGAAYSINVNSFKQLLSLFWHL